MGETGTAKGSVIIDAGGLGGGGISHRPHLPHSPLSLPQVKIWFQNKRSKYKKIMKQGSSAPDGEHLHTAASLSPCSPNIPPLWDIPVPGKGPPLAPSSYINSFGAWYQPHPQDAIPRAPMM